MHSPNSRPFYPLQGSSSTPSLNGISEGPGEHQSLDGFSKRPGEHHQHQLEIPFYSLSQLQALEPAARFQFNPIIGRIQPRTRRASSASAGHRAHQPPGEHHQHQLEKVFAFTLPTPGPSTRGKVPVSTQSLNGFSEGPGEHHQHQLENLFEFTLPTPGPSTRPHQPNHWTDLAKDPRASSASAANLVSSLSQVRPGNPTASIISISWKTFLSPLSQTLQPAARFQFNPIIGRI